MYLSKFKLYLFPENANHSVPQEKLIQLLTDVQFIGEADGNKKEGIQPTRFLTGDNFLSHLCFLGCSPDIEFQPNGDEPYIYIEVPESSDTPQFVFGVNIKVPKCPQCKKELSKLPAILKKSATNPQCPHCKAALDINKVNWRKTAHFSSTSIIINNIYESEAVPDDLLLSALKKATNCNWKYSYIRFDKAT